jgi:hypothetical protein
MRHRGPLWRPRCIRNTSAGTQLIIWSNLRSDKNNGHFTSRPMCIYNIHLTFFLEWWMFQTTVVQIIKIHFMFNNIFFFLLVVPFMRLCGKIRYCHRDYRSQYETAHAQCMLDKATDTLWIRATYCFSVATIVPRTRLNITFIRALPVLLKTVHIKIWLEFHCNSHNTRAELQIKWNISVLN